MTMGPTQFVLDGIQRFWKARGEAPVRAEMSRAAYCLLCDDPMIQRAIVCESDAAPQLGGVRIVKVPGAVPRLVGRDGWAFDL